MSERNNRGQPLVMSAPRSDVSRAIIQLAGQVLTTLDVE